MILLLVCDMFARTLCDFIKYIYLLLYIIDSRQDRKSSTVLNLNFVLSQSSSLPSSVQLRSARSFPSSGLFWYSLSLHKSVHFNHCENNSSQRHDKRGRLHLHDIETVEQQFGLDSCPFTQPAAGWLSPLLLLCRHHPEPTVLGTSVGQQTKLRRQICGYNFSLWQCFFRQSAQGRSWLDSRSPFLTQNIWYLNSMTLSVVVVIDLYSILVNLNRPTVVSKNVLRKFPHASQKYCLNNCVSPHHVQCRDLASHAPQTR